MKIKKRECIENLIESLKMNRDESKICFLKHYSSFEIYENEISMFVEKYHMKNCKFIFHEFAENSMQDACGPFLNVIRDFYYEFYSDMDIKTFLKECNVYPLQSYMFEHYIKNGLCRREEDIIPRESKYERERLIQSIMDILEYILKDNKIVLVLNKLHLAHESTIQILEELVWNRKIQNTVLVCVFNESYIVKAYMNEIWQNFKTRLEDSDFVIKCDDEDDAYSDDIISIFEPDIADIHIYMEKIGDMISTLAFSQAEYYLELIYHAIEIDKIGVSKKIRIQILLMYAIVSVYNGNTKHAYVLCKKVQDTDYLYQDIDCQYYYNYVLSLVKLYSGQRAQALTVLDNARLLARTMDDKEKLLSIDMLNILVLLNGCQDVFIWNMNLEIPKSILVNAEKNNQKNHLAYAYLFGFIDMEIMDTELEGAVNCDQTPYFIKGMSLAKEIDNIDVQLLAWQKNGVVASSVGMFEEIIRYYNKCMEIMKDLNRPEEEIQIYNGIGYSCIINERYDMADECFNKAILKAMKKENPVMIIESIYNMSVNRISMGDYESVVTCNMTVFKIMNMLKLQRIRICNKSKLIGMMIFAYIKLGKFYDAKLNFDKMKTFLLPLLDEESGNFEGWEDDVFLYYIVQGMLNKSDEQYKEAKESFVQARFIWNKARGKQEYIYAKFVEEEAVLYNLLGETKKCKESLESGLSFCKKNKLEKAAQRLRNLFNEHLSKVEEYTKVLDDSMIKEIINMASVYGLKQELKNKTKTLSFFETWVEVLNQDCDSVEELIYGSMNMLQNTFNIDHLIYIEVINNEEPYICYKDKNMDFNQIQARFLLEYIKKNRKKIIISRFEKSYSIHEEFVSIFAKNSIASMAVIPFIKNDKIIAIFVTIIGRHANFTENLNMFTEDDVNVFRTGFRELLEAINREKIKKQLERSSITDILTGLNNRQGMKKYFEDQLKQDDNIPKKTLKKQYTILYLDLDNFKYCNDHFGHDVGDAVIVAFSRMLEKVAGKDDCVVRYGGDEFLVILNNQTEENGVYIAEKIFENIEKNKGFKSVIEKVYKNEINIPKQHRVTCSIGISSGKTGSESGINKILKKADEALYHVKNTTKHDYCVWRKCDVN